MDVIAGKVATIYSEPLNADLRIITTPLLQQNNRMCHIYSELITTYQNEKRNIVQKVVKKMLIICLAKNKFIKLCIKKNFEETNVKQMY